MIDLEAIRKQLASLDAFPWCERWGFEAIRHLVRNCDIECPEHGEACFKFGYDGIFIAQSPQLVSDLITELEASRKECELLQSRAEHWHKMYIAQSQECYTFAVERAEQNAEIERLRKELNCASTPKEGK